MQTLKINFVIFNLTFYLFIFFIDLSDRTDVGDLSNTEDNVYSSPGMMGDSHRSSSMHHHSDMMPPSGYAHHPLLNLQSLHSLFPPGSIHSNNGSSGGRDGGHHHHHHHSGSGSNSNDLAQATRRSLDLMRIRATDPRPCPQCGKLYIIYNSKFRN